MLNSLIPPAVFQIALTACLLLPILLACISWLAPRNTPAKTRLAWSIVVSPLVAVYAGIQLIPEVNSKQAVEWINVGCAGLLYATAVMVIYSAWGLLGYGFTVSILLDVERAGAVVSRRQLIQSFADGHGLTAFVRDRSALLLKMRLMEIRENKYIISGYKSIFFARIIRFVMEAYEVKEGERN
jgi:hypothetical protein